MNKTKIDWCDYSWNPVTGCLNGCEYCYARKIAERFAERLDDGSIATPEGLVDIVDTNIPFPYGFAPTFHRYRLDRPQKIKKPKNVLVCSMADLFGDWVPDEWISEVFKACIKAPQHRYLFLTKNPKRYKELERNGNLPELDNFWYGTTITGSGEECLNFSRKNGFLSIEPLLEEIEAKDMWRKFGWVIVGAETGNRKGKVSPKKEWVEKIVSACHKANVPIFMKESLREPMGQDFIQEFPWQAS